VVKENYPYLQVHERKEGFVWERHAKDEIEKWKKGRTGYGLDLFGNMLEGLNGHAGVFTKDEYAACYGLFSSGIKTHPEYKAWMEVLDRPEVRKAYGLEGNAVGGGIVGGKGEGRGTPSLAIEDRGNLLYFPIPTFNYGYIDGQGKEIIGALGKGSREGKAIVFDIRGNGGGSDSYWADNIVGPLAGRKLEARYAILYKGGKEAGGPNFEFCVHFATRENGSLT
jgi:hypothetical protein